MTEPNHHAVLAIAMAVAALAAWIDWRKGEIPNWLTFPAMVAAPLLHVGRYWLARHPLEASLMEGAYSIGGALLCALVPMILYRKGAIGGGDVKLFVAIGALMQPLIGVEAQTYSFFAGAILAPARLAYEGKLFATMKNALLLGANVFLPSAKQRTVDATALSWVRLGPAIALGVALAAYLHW